MDEPQSSAEPDAQMNLSSKKPKLNGTQGSCLQKQTDRFFLSQLTPEQLVWYERSE